MNPEPKDPCAGGRHPPSTNRSGTGTTSSVSNPWHLLHAMRAMRISSQEPPADSVESGEVQLGGEPPGKGEDNFRVSRYLISGRHRFSGNRGAHSKFSRREELAPWICTSLFCLKELSKHDVVVIFFVI